MTDPLAPSAVHCLNANCSSFTRNQVDTGLVTSCSSILTLPITMTILPSGFPLIWYEKGFDNYRAVCNNAACDAAAITKDPANILSSRGMFADHTGKPYQLGVDDCPSDRTPGADGTVVSGGSLECMYVRVCNSDCSQVVEYNGLPFSRFSEPVGGVLNGRTVVYGATYRKNGEQKIVMYDITDLVACVPPNCPTDAASSLVMSFGLIAALVALLAMIVA
jgi:hypothetical protein